MLTFGPGEMTPQEKDFFYDEYLESYEDEDDCFAKDEFGRLIDAGHIYCCGVYCNDEPFGVFGVEIMLAPMVHLSFLFYAGKYHREMFEPIFHWLFEALQVIKRGVGSDEPGAVRLVGRDGWQRMLTKRGFMIDADGYIREDQKAVGDGLYQWLQ